MRLAGFAKCWITQFGFLPRPLHICAGFSGFRYLAGMTPPERLVLLRGWRGRFALQFQQVAAASFELHKLKIRPITQ